MNAPATSPMTAAEVKTALNDGLCLLEQVSGLMTVLADYLAERSNQFGPAAASATHGTLALLERADGLINTANESLHAATSSEGR